jgi:hypothetical protein
MFSAADLAFMRNTQNNHMMDECIIYSTISGSALDSYGRPTLTSGSALSVCGLDMRASTENDQAGAQSPNYDARVRLPITDTITRIDQVKVTKRFSEAITPITFQVEGDALRGPSGLVLNLKYTGAK